MVQTAEPTTVSQELREAPGPRNGFLGLRSVRQFRRRPLEFVTELGSTYGDIARFRLGPIRAYLVNSPDLIHEVLVTKMKSFPKLRQQTRVLKQIEGKGLLVSWGDHWLKQRRQLQPAFHVRRMAGYAQVTVDYTQRMLDGWTPGRVMNVADEMTHVTANIIAKTMFSLETADQAVELRKIVRVLSATFLREMGAGVLLPDWLPLPGKRQKRWAVRSLDKLIWDIVRRRRASGEDRGDLLSLLLLPVEQGGCGMNDRQARDECVTMFNSGHDTTAAALAWTWYLIGSHADVASRLCNELESVLGDREATFEDLPRLTYMEMVVKESIRLYPPGWALIGRMAIEETELGGYRIPKGSWVYIFPYVTHRDARFFKDPMRFDPERFTPERAAEIPPYAYFPFGVGPHMCIGNTFSMMEMKLIVAAVLRRFSLRLDALRGPIVEEPLLSIVPKGGLWMAADARRAIATAGVS